MDFILLIWHEGLLRPMLNLLVFLSAVLGNNFGISIIVFTILMRLVLMPLTLRQLRSTKKMMALQPRLQEVQKKYGKDKQRQSQEMMKAYKEAGVSPLGCLGPMVIQFPIWIGLYQAILQALPTTPEPLVKLSQNLYPAMPFVQSAVPLNSGFLWLDLGFPDPTPVMAILTAASMWVVQKMSTMPTTDPRQQSTNQMMQWMLPLMFAFFTFTLPSGLALYWVASNIISIVMQYFITGWGGLATVFQRKQPVPAPAPAAAPAQAGKESVVDANAKRGDSSQDSGGSDRARHQRARRSARRGRGHRFK
ncbi:MAG: membrane protein insertase YidC [Chloroflexi bacterium]|nr:membrane protein insertase YidC [Chloroflexota bacterium]